MTDPRRWLDPESDARIFEREVLELAKPVNVPAASRERVWQRVAMLNQPPVGAGETGASGGGGGGGATAGTPAGGLAVIKLFVVGALAGLAFTGAGYAVFVDDRPSVPADKVSGRPIPGSLVSAPLALPTPLTTPLAAPDESPVPKTAPLPRKVTPAPATSSEPLETEQPLRAPLPAEPGAQPTALESQLREEAALIREGRARLRAGDLAGAFATLEAARTRFPRAVLAEEREALTIELLARSGRLESARERARAFLVQFPESSLRQRMQQLSQGTRDPGRLR